MSVNVDLWWQSDECPARCGAFLKFQLFSRASDFHFMCDALSIMQDLINFVLESGKDVALSSLNSLLVAFILDLCANVINRGS